MKECSDCQNTLPESEFNLASSKSARLQPYCRECQSAHQKEWYQKNKNRRKRQVNQQRKELRLKLKEILDKIKDVPCKDCNQKYNPWQMDFDHLKDKKANVGELANGCYSVEVVLEEVAKCEVVCANCHRDRTHKRNQGPIEY